MEVRPGYKQTEVGVIPRDWSVRPLGGLVTFLDGMRRPVKEADRARMRGSIPYYGASGIVDYVNDYLFDEDLILLGEDGENILSRNSRLAFRISGKAWVNNHAHVLRANPNISIGFLTDYLESLNYERLNSGTAQPKLNKRNCLRIGIALPPTKAEQEAIAAALSDVATFCESTEQLTAKKRRLKEGAMQELLTGKARLPGFRGEWKVRRLGDLGGFLKGSGVTKDEAKSGDLACVRYGEIYTRHNDYIRAFDSRISPDVALKATRLKQGDILFAGSGETKEEIGKCAAFVDDLEAYAGGDIVILRVEEGNPLFLGYYLNTEPINRQKASKGQGDAVVHISSSALAGVQVTVPLVSEQIAIAGIFSDMDAEIAAGEAKLTKARQLKQGMMQEMLTGRIRLA
jgi:type I restriction enzyme S subunit